MDKILENTTSCAAFARRHGVSKTTVRRWRDAGYVVPTTGPVDVARSEKLLAGRPAESRGGLAKGPTADGSRLAYWITLFTREGETEGGEWAIVCRNIVAALRKFPSDASDADVERLAERIAGV